MKKTTSIIGFTALAAIVGYKITEEPEYIKATKAKSYAQLSSYAMADTTPAQPVNTKQIGRSDHNSFTNEELRSFISDSLLTVANKLIGDTYVYGGNEPGGFDCSGFTNYVYGTCGFDVPHGSVNQAEAGKQIPVEEARRGDLLIFTGTNLSIREPGHAGIVISKSGEKPVRFIHSSSNGGVKISEVDGTRYEERLLQVRRIY